MYIFVGIRYSLRDLLCTSIIMHDPQTNDMGQIGKCQCLWHQLALASCEFYV